MNSSSNSTRHRNPPALIFIVRALLLLSLLRGAWCSETSSSNPTPVGPHSTTINTNATSCSSMQARMPTMYLTHGGGPMPLLGDTTQAPLTRFLKTASKLLPQRPKAIVVFTAHWEEAAPTLSTNPTPPMLYDYSGFPPESYRLQYPAPGGPPALITRTEQLLAAAGFPVKENSKRGFDHGTFVPLMLMFPEADIPVLQMSILNSLDPAAHFALGAALAPLRDEGVLLLGSGSSFHNMQGFFGGGGKAMTTAAKAFDDWLVDTCTKRSGASRQSLLESWISAPGGKMSHPREEHLIPLMVAAGAAAGGPEGQQVHKFEFGPGIPVSSFMFT